MVNFFDLALQKQDFEIIKEYLPILDQLTQNVFLAFQRVIFLFYQGLLAVLIDKKTEEAQLCQQAIDTMDFLGYLNYRDSFVLIFNTFLHS